MGHSIRGSPYCTSRRPRRLPSVSDPRVGVGGPSGHCLLFWMWRTQDYRCLEDTACQGGIHSRARQEKKKKGTTCMPREAILLLPSDIRIRIWVWQFVRRSAIPFGREDTRACRSFFLFFFFFCSNRKFSQDAKTVLGCLCPQNHLASRPIHTNGSNNSHSLSFDCHECYSLRFRA